MINNVKIDYVIALDRLLKSKASNEQVLDWYQKSGYLYSNTDIKNTLRVAGREDLKDLLIKEEDIKVGDIVKSRMTSREGKVIKVHWNGDTLTVAWDAGGTQLLAKESVFKLHGKFNPEERNFSKVRTDMYGYNNLDKEDMDFTKGNAVDKKI